MASSVSSERAFSAASITISKCRNCLNGAIVEALQCLKCLYNEDLIFREVLTYETVEKELDSEVDLGTLQTTDEAVKEAEAFRWDQLVLNNEDDKGIKKDVITIE